jgi:hypothetical protein
MVLESGVGDDGNHRIVRNEIRPFQMTPFYQASIHTQYNPDCTNTTFVGAFASEDYGIEQVLDYTFASANGTHQIPFGQAIAGEDIDFIRNAIPARIVLGVETCLQSCRIEKRTLNF